jgi:hypothetical protein
MFLCLFEAKMRLLEKTSNWKRMYLIEDDYFRTIGRSERDCRGLPVGQKRI